MTILLTNGGGYQHHNITIAYRGLPMSTYTNQLVSASFCIFLLVLPTLADYEVVFFDDFLGTEINADYWQINNNTKHCSPCELSLYLEKNVEVKDGNLVITTMRETVIGGPSNEEFNYTSGWVVGKPTFYLGKFEVRAKLPPQTATGAWPAHWLMPKSDQCWPTGGEIDIMEATSNPWSYHIFGSYRWGVECTEDKQILPGGTYPPLGEPLINWAEDYHIFSVEWTDTEMIFGVDGIDYEVKTSDEVIFPTYPMYFILDTAVSWYMPPGPNAIYPATHVIDWVRVSQLPAHTD